MLLRDGDILRPKYVGQRIVRVTRITSSEENARTVRAPLDFYNRTYFIRAGRTCELNYLAVISLSTRWKRCRGGVSIHKKNCINMASHTSGIYNSISAVGKHYILSLDAVGLHKR